MKRTLFFILLSASFSLGVRAQVEENEMPTEEELRPYRLRLQWYRFRNPVLLDGQLVNEYLLPEVYCYGPLKFKNEHQRRAFNRLVYNVKRVLPIAQEVRDLVEKVDSTLNTLPDKKAKKEYMKQMEKDIKAKYTPEMKKLTYSQGKLLIKLVDRECERSSYEIVKTFLGTVRATFYQVFAWTFRASLKKQYRPESDDRLIERVVQQVETGQL